MENDHVVLVGAQQVLLHEFEHILPSHKHLARAERGACYVRNREDTLEGPGCGSTIGAYGLWGQLHRIGEFDLPSHIYGIVER